MTDRKEIPNTAVLLLEQIDVAMVNNPLLTEDQVADVDRCRREVD